MSNRIIKMIIIIMEAEYLFKRHYLLIVIIYRNFSTKLAHNATTISFLFMRQRTKVPSRRWGSKTFGVHITSIVLHFYNNFMIYIVIIYMYFFIIIIYLIYSNNL